MAQRLLGFLLGLAACLLALPGSTQVLDVQVGIVRSQTSAPYLEATQALVKGLARQGVPRDSVEIWSPAELAALPATRLSGIKVWVALGTEAATGLAQSRFKAPVLNALLPRSGFERVLRASGRKASARFNVLELDQPLQRQLALLRLALPKVRRLGVLWGPDSSPKAPALRSLASSQGLSLKEAQLDDETSLFSALQSVLAGSDVLLALADPLVFNSSNIQNILMTTIRVQVPLFAFSPAYVRAGALLAVYSTPPQVGEQAAQWVLGVLANRTLPELALEPLDFEISVNEQVARVLGLSFDVKALTLALKRQEQQP
ncbi:MAG: ABC transporter substrate binding protein [Rhodoferax sp.]|nr:ABC transporter substrate binding protein [Rhodoferax sp.]